MTFKRCQVLRTLSGFFGIEWS